MRSAFCLRATLLAPAVLALVALPLAARDPLEKKTPRAKDKIAEEKVVGDKVEKLVVLATLVGTLQKVSESTGDITVRITIRTLEANAPAQAAYVRQQQALLARQQQIMKVRNPIQRQQQLNQLYQDALRLQQSQANLFKIKETQQNVDLRLAEDAKVRTVLPPEAFDEKGNIKVYTAKELKELKGDPKLPGFQAERDAIEVGRTVLVQIGRKVLVPVRKGKGKDKEKAKEEEKDTEREKEPAKEKDKPNRPLVYLILVGPEPMKN
jgi:hypothetical protein